MNRDGGGFVCEVVEGRLGMPTVAAMTQRWRKVVAEVWENGRWWFCGGGDGCYLVGEEEQLKQRERVFLCFLFFHFSFLFTV